MLAVLSGHDTKDTLLSGDPKRVFVARGPILQRPRDRVARPPRRAPSAEPTVALGFLSPGFARETHTPDSNSLSHSNTSSCEEVYVSVSFFSTPTISYHVPCCIPYDCMYFSNQIVQCAVRSPSLASFRPSVLQRRHLQPLQHSPQDDG